LIGVRSTPYDLYMEFCPYLESCQLYPLFRLRASLRTWQIRYCEADYRACARYLCAKKGESVPRTLLPNGRSLPIFKAEE
jgi:hypothetical protein